MADNHKQSDQFDAALPLPQEVNLHSGHSSSAGSVHQPSGQPANAAADIIRKRVEAAYGSAPDLTAETTEITQLDKADQGLSKHQKFILELTSSGKPLSEIQAGWHEYYAGLPDADKHAVWQEFYKLHENASAYSGLAPSVKAAGSHADEVAAAHQKPVRKRPAGPVGKRATAVHHYVRKNVPAIAKIEAKQPLRSLGFGLGVGCIVMLVFLFSFFNERFIAPFIQPSRTATNAPIISSSTAVGPDPQVIIPEINVQIPVVYGIDTINDAAVETALEDGVVHYADTADPGQDGNAVYVGHSSNNIFNPGKYKFAFVLLSKLQTGDTFYLQKDGKRYTYQIYEKEIVSPTDTSVLGLTDKPATATLITCDPPGTSTNRLVVIGEQIDPDPSTNVAAASTNNSLATQSAVLPGNAPTLWSRLVKWFES